MPETARGIWYPESGAPADVPTDMEKLAEGVDGLLGEVGLDQLVAAEEDDGKLVIVKDGAAAYKAMSGDATIDEDGKLAIGKEKILAEMLAKKVVGTDKLNDGAVTEGKTADGAITSRKFKPTVDVVIGGEDFELGAAYQDVPGAVLEITPAVPSILKVTAVFQFEVRGEDPGRRAFGTIRLDAADQTPVAELGDDLEHLADEILVGTVAQVYALPLTAAPHTIKMRARRQNGSGSVCKGDSGSTRFLYELIAS